MGVDIIVVFTAALTGGLLGERLGRLTWLPYTVFYLSLIALPGWLYFRGFSQSLIDLGSFFGLLAFHGSVVHALVREAKRDIDKSGRRIEDGSRTVAN